MKTYPEELQAARLRLVKTHPYLASAAWALQPKATPGLGTLAVDMWWRLYFDPAVITRWTVEELSGVLYHEIMHLLRDHASRMKDFDPRVSNICTDAEINDDLLAEGIALPENPITPESIGQPNGLLAEEYYAALENQAWQSASGQDASAQSKDGGRSQAKDSRQEDGQAETCDESAPGEGTSSTDHDGDEASAPNPSSTAVGDSQAGGNQPDDRGNSSGSKAGDFDGSESGDGEKGETGGDSAGSSSGSSSSGQPSDSSGRSGDSSQLPNQSGESRIGGQDSRESGDDRGQIPAPGSGRCGSCATGHQEPWEEGPPGKDTSPGTSRAEAELIRRDAARRIREHSKARGSAPGHLTRWANEKLRPKVDWRKELAAMVRHAMADVAGAVDYSYRRPSRRQGQVGNGRVVLPSLRRPIPSVAVVVDTSGSVSDTMLAQALGEISGILKGLGQREGVHVLAVDSDVQACSRVFRPEQVKMAGGGGTDMGRGLEAAARLRPAPQVAVVITDGYTPWPDRAPRGMKVIVALTGSGEVPDWARVVKVEKEG